MTVPDNRGKMYLILLIRAISSSGRLGIRRFCLIYDQENAEGAPILVQPDKIIKHIDYRKNSIFIIYYEKSMDQISEDVDESYLKMSCFILEDIDDLFAPDWYLRGTALFLGEDLRRPGFLEYSDRQSFPLVITNSAGSSLLKMWVLNSAENYKKPACEIDQNEVKDYRHFQNYFLHILHPSNMVLSMKLIDLLTGDILATYELCFDSKDLENSRQLSTLEIFKHILIFQIKGSRIQTIDLLTHKENFLAGTHGQEYDSLIFLEKQNRILANQQTQNQSQIWNLNDFSVITIHKDFLAPGIERYRIGSLTYQPYHIFRDQNYILAYRPEPLDCNSSLNMVKKKVLCQKRQHDGDQDSEGQQSCLKL